MAWMRRREARNPAKKKATGAKKPARYQQLALAHNSNKHSN
jgi:hypothetical protein